MEITEFVERVTKFSDKYKFPLYIDHSVNKEYTYCYSMMNILYVVNTFTPSERIYNAFAVLHNGKIISDRWKIFSNPFDEGVLLGKEHGIVVDSCSHEWKHYIGILDQYDFCTKCDVKRGNV